MHLPTCLAALALLLPLVSQAAPLYTVSLLPAGFDAYDIDNAGGLSGFFTDSAGATHAALYANGAVTDLGALAAGYRPRAINATGAVTGSFVLNDQAHAFLYRDGQLTDIGAGTNGIAINARGDVVGQRWSASGYTGFVYRHGKLTGVGNLGTGDIGLARDINDRGQIVGESNIDPALHAPFHPFLYDHGALLDLGTLANRELNGAQVINNAGQIAGYSDGPSGAIHAFFYDDGVLHDAGTFGTLNLDVTDINEHGVFVGGAATRTGSNVGFLYLDNTVVDLNTLVDPVLGWQIGGAFAINDIGQILASACRDGACMDVRLDLASSVSEPGSALLLLPGLLAVAGVRRRQRRLR
jgi:probable HAF family extracellular repeat protein